MIRIERPKMPDILQGTGKREGKTNCESYDCHSDEYRSGSRKFKFEKGIYAHDSVKNALLEAQHSKCCYCESKFRATYPGAVEHFRPKGAVQQERNQGREYPGYYWLAYSWENLLVSCHSCNSKKGTLFPLSDPGARARNHCVNMGAEHPLLVDPASEEPRQHIRFRGSASVPLTKRGRETIRVLGLDRSGLEEERREKLASLDNLKLIAGLGEKVDREWVERARKLLEGAVCPDARYSSMARDFLKPDNALEEN